MNGHRALDEASLPVFVEELNTSQVDDPYLCILDSVDELLGLLGHWRYQDKSPKDSRPDQSLFNIELHASRLALHSF